MASETKQCQNCKNSFIIEADDFAFYEKMKVPPPTWCPDCRQQRRYAWRNERVLYRRNCDLCKKNIVTIYSSNKPFKVYCPTCFWSDKWNGTDYARDFDFSRSFFEQFQELQREVPRIALLTKNSVSSEYTNHASDNKNCYLVFGAINCENILNSTNTFGCQDSMDCYWISDSQLLYECIYTYKSYNCQYGLFLEDCNDCIYGFDLRGCSNCFLSSNLRNKQYYFLNQPHSKEEYFKKIKEFELGSSKARKELYEDYLKLIQNNSLHPYAVIKRSKDSTGNVIFMSKNARNCFTVDNMEDVKNVIVALDAKTCMDSYHFGYGCELTYECHAMFHAYNTRFVHLSYDNRFITYCDSCHNTENLFGCVGIKQGSYCILNKQYTKEEYEELVPKVVEHMKKMGEWGEFFPPSMSPFGYNETQGQIYMPLTKDEVLKRGWNWEERIPGTFDKETIQKEALPDNIEATDSSITKEIFKCEQCSKNYNIIQPEFDFYRRMLLPLSRLCSDCRYMRRIALQPSRKLWHRQCMCDKTHLHHQGQCKNEFETSYAPDRREIVYCESCYNSEVV